MDFDNKILLTECILIGAVTKGMFNYNDIHNLEFKDYDLLFSQCEEIFKKIYCKEEE